MERMRKVCAEVSDQHFGGELREKEISRLCIREQELGHSSGGAQVHFYHTPMDDDTQVRLSTTTTSAYHKKRTQ